jgi:hypothetical protein
MTDTQTVQEMAEIRQRVEQIEAAIMRTADLLKKAIQGQRKAQILLSHTDGHMDLIPQTERTRYEQLEQTDQAAGEITST